MGICNLQHERHSVKSIYPSTKLSCFHPATTFNEILSLHNHQRRIRMTGSEEDI
ncbi:predicted protein [Botrytis cinerea T4]|uniref:Uncharacterized protein n=1 Tax=Botryotinia fuckeliana (strain T4) TaxID=999810 RepID=G2XRH3_BOTF4|nr:predicted protein [Botrytis cinerea T4]